jgi:hypothetical protein
MECIDNFDTWAPSSVFGEVASEVEKMKKSKTMIRHISKHIDKIIIAVSYIILFFLLLGLVPGILYREKLVEVGIWQETREIKNNKFIIRYHMNSGDNKPTVLTSGGEELLAVDGSGSTIEKGNDNSRRSLWDHIFRNVAASDFIIHDIAWDNYQMMQTATLWENQVTFEYKFFSTENENVQLTLSLKHRYDNYSTLTFNNIKINENQENKLFVKYAVKLELDNTFAAEENVRYSIDNALYWLRLTFYAENIPADNNWHNVARLVMSYSLIERESQE